MKKTLLAILLACGAPLAQAQAWNQVIEAQQPEQFLSLAPERALALDGTGLLFVQTSNLRKSGPASIDLHALDESGNRLLALTSPVPVFTDIRFEPKGVSARNGDRVTWIEVGSDTLRRPLVLLYRNGQTMQSGFYGFQNGAILTHAIADGAGGVIMASRPQPQPSRPWMIFHGVGTAYWTQTIGGCPGGPNLEVELLALDLDHDSGTLTAVSRCLAASSPGAIGIQTFDPTTGARLSARQGWPYPDSAAPVISVQPIGNGAFVLEQRDATTGERLLRRIDIDSDGSALPLPAGFVPQKAARHVGGALVAAVNTTTHEIGAWQFEDGRARWLYFPSLSGSGFPYLPDFPPTRFAWSGDAAGNTVVAFKRPQSDASGPVQIVAISPQGKELWRRSIADYPFTQPVGNVAMIAADDGVNIVLAADEVAREQPGATWPTGVIHVERFRVDGDYDTIPWNPVPWPGRP